ncbi:hypothetical protein F4819DRAFT_222521 [Hypoxylon fuscum]|nr:hypothetical protein F4819DRAFT_222521 [Hypoxylon fuscum]
MDSSHNTEGQNDVGSRTEMDSKPGTLPQFPPPEALPAYVNRALPPPPGSNSSSSNSSVYGSPVEGAGWRPTPKIQLPLNQQQDGPISPAGFLDEAGLAMVQPLEPTTVSSPQGEIASPQPRYPAHSVLAVKDRNDDIVSPVSAGLAGTNSHQQYEVSPISPTASECSLHSAISESAHTSSSTRSSLGLMDRDIALSRTLRRHGLYAGNRKTHSSGDLAAGAQPHSPHHQVHQINERYSDPGSPISGAVIHPPTSFPSDPSLRSRSSRYSKAPALAQDQEPEAPASQTAATAPQHPQAPSHSKSESGAKLAQTPSAGSASRVQFAAARSNSYSTRPRAGSKRAARAPPPPLKLSERPLVDNYVKTPFPDLGGGDAETRRSRSSFLQWQHMHGKGAVEGKGKVKEKEKEEGEGEEGEKGDQSGGGGGGSTSSATKKRNRVSSLPGFGFARSFRSGSLNKDKSDRDAKRSEPQAAAPSEVRSGYVSTGGPSRTPSVSKAKVKNILSKAKQIGLGHGLGLGMSSEEAKKERRREEMKRQIRVSEPRRELG